MDARVSSVALTPLSLLRRSRAVFADRTAIVSEGSAWTYAEFGDAVDQLGAALTTVVGRGERVAVLSPNSPMLLAAHFAIPAADAVIVAINTRLTAPEIAHILTHSGARVLLLDAELCELAVAATALMSDPPIIALCAPDAIVPSDFVGRHGQRSLQHSVADENAPIAINYTSGTTGAPKGVVYTHRGAYLNALGVMHHLRLDAASRYLWTLPMFHCNGWCTTWAVTGAGGRHVVQRAVRGASIWQALLTEEITHLCGAPTVLTTIVLAPERRPLPRAVRMIVGGAPPAPAILARLEELGVQTVHAYGLTEVYGPFTTCEYRAEWDAESNDQRAWLMSRQGVAMIQSGGLRVVDARLHDVPADGETLGEIVMRGNNVMKEYFRDPEATQRAFAGGWFHSGDLGVMHPDGYVEVKDRMKDIIISGGENISSIEVEGALLAHPSITDAAVIALPDPRWGERPIAYISVQTAIDSSELRAFLRDRLAHYKVPDEFYVLAALPRTSTGKIVKRELRDLLNGQRQGEETG